jgi:hypothetical protein
MPRGYRLFVLALGLVLSCAIHADAKGGNEQAQADQTITKSLGDIAAANRQKAERAQRADQDEAPCGQGKYGSSADLCAQWKAADAAADSAWWAWVAAISTIISTAAVLVAIGLTYQANAIARSTAKRELRAYIFPAGFNLDWQLNLKDGAQNAVLNVVIKNSGTTPARRFQIDIRHSFEFSELDQFSAIAAYGQYSLLGPNETINSPSIRIPADEVTRSFREPAPVYVFGGFFYEDIFGEKHETRFCFKVVFQRKGEGDIPNWIQWEYCGKHNCSDDECAEMRALVPGHVNVFRAQ